MWIIITGASSGIGEACAWRLAKRGSHNLLLVGRRPEKLSAVAKSCALETECRVETLPCDLSTDSGRERLGSWLLENEPISGLINSAGVGQFEPLMQISEATYARIMDTNVAGLLFTTKLVVGAMLRDAVSGTVVNISSDADSTGFSDASIYCASKGAVRLLSKALRIELQKQRIRISTVSPGRVDTFFNNKQPGMRPGALSAQEVAEVVEFVICCSFNIELSEIRLDSMSRA